MVGYDQEQICKYSYLVCQILNPTDLGRYKAIALGADFVQLGRPILWGLAHEGEAGVRHVLKSLLAEFDLTVGLSGHENLGQINSTSLRAVG